MRVFVALPGASFYDENGYIRVPRKPSCDDTACCATCSIVSVEYIGGPSPLLTSKYYEVELLVSW